jgi:hypothetical protein
MIEQTITEFINGYTHDNRDSIAFVWNQKHGAELRDSNYKVRQDVIAAVVDAPEQVSIDLLHDLFEAEARWSKEAWCICDGFAKIGMLMLKRGGTNSLDHFLAWFSNSFDTFCGCHTMQLDPITVDALLQEVNRRLAATPKDPDKSSLEMAKGLFEKFKKGNPAEGLFKLSTDTKFKDIRVVSKFEIWIHKLKSMLIGRG